MTGATGFLGGHLIDTFQSKGVPCIAIGRDPGNCQTLEKKGVRVIAHDLTQPLQIDCDLDAIVHCAALSAAFGKRQAFVQANVEATRNVVALARSTGVRRFVHISSPTVYFSMRDMIDTAEDTTLPKPINAYAETKRMAEKIVLSAPEISPVVLRPRGIYGEGDRTLLPSLLTAAARRPLPLLRGGRASIDLTHVSDVVSAIWAALEADRGAESEIFNISSGESVAITEIVNQSCHRAGIDVSWRPTPLPVALALARLMENAAATFPFLPPPVVTRYSLGLFAYAQSLNISKAKARLNWRPEVDFANGLDMTFANSGLGPHV